MGLFDFFDDLKYSIEDFVDEVSGAKAERHARWRKETKKKIRNIRLKALKTGNCIWEEHCHQNINVFLENEYELLLVKNVLLNIGQCIASNSIPYELPKRNINKYEIRKFNEEKLLEYGEINYPYVYSQFTYNCKEDPFIKVIDKLMRNKLRDDTKLIKKWNKFHTEIREFCE